MSFFVCFFLVFISFVDRVAAGGRLTASVITRRIERRRSCGCGDVRRRARWTTLVVCGPLSTGGKKKTKSDRGDFHWVPTRSVFRPWRIFCSSIVVAVVAVVAVVVVVSPGQCGELSPR